MSKEKTGEEATAIDGWVGTKVCSPVLPGEHRVGPETDFDFFFFLPESLVPGNDQESKMFISI